MTENSGKASRNAFIKSATFKSKKCEISGTSYRQNDFAHIIPFNTCNNFGYPDDANTFNNGMILNKCIHASFEIENYIPLCSLERIDIIPGKSKL